MSFSLPGVGHTYYCDDINELDTKMLRWGNTYQTSGMDRTALAQFIHWRSTRYRRGAKDNDTLVTVSTNAVKVYTNDATIASELKNLGYDITVTIAIVSVPSGIMQFAREPKHKFRTYFKSKQVDAEFRANIADFLEQYKDSVFACGALKQWVKFPKNRWTSKFLNSSFFIEYDNDGIQTIAMLMFGTKFLGKHYELKKR